MFILSCCLNPDQCYDKLKRSKNCPFRKGVDMLCPTQQNEIIPRDAVRLKMTFHPPKNSYIFTLNVLRLFIYIQLKCFDLFVGHFAGSLIWVKFDNANWMQNVFFLADYFTYHNQPSCEKQVNSDDHLTGLYTFHMLVVRIFGFSLRYNSLSFRVTKIFPP